MGGTDNEAEQGSLESDNSEDEDHRVESESDSGSCHTEFEENDNEIAVDDEGINVNVQVDAHLENLRKEKEGRDEDGQKGKNDGGSSGSRVMGYTFKDDDSEYESSDCELASVHESSDDEGERVPVFNPRTDMKDPKFKLKMVFPSFDMLKKAVRAYSVKNRQPVDFKKNDNRKVRVVYRNRCPWLLVAGKYKDGPRV